MPGGGAKRKVPKEDDKDRNSRSPHKSDPEDKSESDKKAKGIIAGIKFPKKMQAFASLTKGASDSKKQTPPSRNRTPRATSQPRSSAHSRTKQSLFPQKSFSSDRGISSGSASSLSSRNLDEHSPLARKESSASSGYSSSTIVGEASAGNNSGSRNASQIKRLSDKGSRLTVGLLSKTTRLAKQLKKLDTSDESISTQSLATKESDHCSMMETEVYFEKCRLPSTKTTASKESNEESSERELEERFKKCPPPKNKPAESSSKPYHPLLTESSSEDYLEQDSPREDSPAVVSSRYSRSPIGSEVKRASYIEIEETAKSEPNPFAVGIDMDVSKLSVLRPLSKDKTKKETSTRPKSRTASRSSSKTSLKEKRKKLKKQGRVEDSPDESSGEDKE